MIEFGFPYALLLLPLPFLVFLVIPPYRQQVAALRFPFFRALTTATGTAAGPGAIIVTRNRAQRLAASAIWILVIVALARPERVGEPIVMEKAARDLVLAIDLSGSMDQVDFIAPDGSRFQRLDAVKRVVDRFIAERDGDRVALIVFGTKAFVQSPFTEDLETVRALLDQATVGMAGPHTAIGDAIGLSIRAFQASDIEDRLLILLSDGADAGSRMTPLNAAEIAAREGIDIVTIGVGDPEGSGEQRVDVDTLQAIAETANGAFFFADDEAALVDIYARIDALAPREVETQSYRPREPLDHWLLALAVLIGLATMAFLHVTTARRRPA